MPALLQRRIRLPPDARSARQVRRMLQEVLDGIPDLDPEVTETAVLLASELAENAVLHAGTEFEVGLDVDEASVTVTVTDRGSGPLEAHLAEPRRRYGRAASHGRGLGLVAQLASAWGTRHDEDGRHAIWFTLTSTPAAPVPAAAAPPDHAPHRVSPEQARRLLHVPAGLADRLQPLALVEELVRRLRDVLDVLAVTVVVDEGDSGGAAEIARAGPAGGAVVLDVPLPVTPPLRGSIRLLGPPSDADGGSSDLVELVAYRIAMAVETRWLRAVDQRRRAWMAYLAEASELLGQSLSVELAVAVVPQVVVPRLGRWCAVYLAEAGTVRLAALTHADENELPELRAALDPDARPGPSPELRALLGPVAEAEAAPVHIATPTDGLAVALRSRGAFIGTLLVGRPDGRPHAPEDIVLITDIARRAALAVQNAQSAAAHVAVSQALQQALLPRALPAVPELDLASEYLPASRGTDVGGDFYDVFAVDSTPDGERLLVSIGDVCGKGARAAARTGLVRDVLRVLVRAGRGLSDAVHLLNEVMMEAADPLQFCTLAAAIIQRDGSGFAVELLLAGHERPVLLRADGRTEQVGAFGTAVGLLPRALVEVTTHRLDPGDTLLLYTDGVTERRRGREQFGPDRLLAVAARTAGQPARRLVAAIRQAVERFSADPATDDVALLAVRALPD